MAEAEIGATGRQSRRFLYLYALAVAGGAVAYVPFLTILLPNHVTTLGKGQALGLMAYTTFAGAVTASLANIAFGWASDRTGSRRPWVWGGLVLCTLLLPAMQFATTPIALIGLIVAWQASLNMMLAPLAAWAGDCVPNSQKGLLGGLLAFAPALGALSGASVTTPGLADPAERLTAVALLVLAMVSPVLLFGRPLPMPELMARESNAMPDDDKGQWTPMATMWLARLCVQIAEASLFAFLLLWFRSVAPDFSDHDAASIFAAVLCGAVVFALVAGRWSDKAERPILPLIAGAAISAVGLLIMALATSLPMAIAGYVIFSLASGIFLALHSSQTLRVLPAFNTRGRNLGFFNLTNTVPSLVMPWLTMAMVPDYGFKALFLLLAGLALLACLILIPMDQAGRRA